MTYRPTVPPLHEATVTDWIRHHMYRGLGALPDGTPYHADLAETQANVRCNRDPHFDALRNARLQMGHLRYGVIGRFHSASVVESIIKRLREYEKTGNREHLVDVANLAEIEWIWPQREGTYWDAQDCGGHWSLRNQGRNGKP